MRRISRRRLLLSTAATLACGRRKVSGFPGYCFVANRSGRSLGVIDLDRFRPAPTVKLEAAPTVLLGHPTLPRVFALAPEAGSVYEIGAASFKVERRVRAGNLAAGMQLSPDGQSLWVLLHDPPSLVEVSLDSLRVGRRILLPSAPDTFDLSTDHRAAVACVQDRSVVLASLRSGKIERIIDSRDEPSLVRWRKDGKQLIAGSRPDRSLGIFHADTGNIVVRLPLPIEPHQFAGKADGGQLFISGAGSDAVVILYPYRTEVAETMLAGRSPAGMAVLDSPPYLFVTNPATDSLTILNFDNMGRKLVAAIQVGQEPRHVTITPDRQYALVLNEKSGDMAVVRLPSLAAPALSRRYRPAALFTMVPVGERPVSSAIVRFS